MITKRLAFLLFHGNVLILPGRKIQVAKNEMERKSNRKRMEVKVLPRDAEDLDSEPEVWLIHYFAKPHSSSSGMLNSNMLDIELGEIGL